MTSETEIKDWETSVERALGQVLEMGGFWRIDPKGGELLSRTLLGLRTKIPVRWAMQPIAMYKIDDIRLSSGACLMRVIMLVQQGYPLGEAMLFWRNLRFAIGEDINPHAMQLWTRDQIIEHLGEAFGRPVADAIASPSSNPILRALMFKQHGEELYRPAALAWTEVEIEEQNFQFRPGRVKIGVPSGVVNGNALTPDVPLSDIPPSDAAEMYQRVTNGGFLDATFYLDPKEMDYAAEAEKAEKALWEADGGRDAPFARRAPARRSYLPMWKD